MHVLLARVRRAHLHHQRHVGVIHSPRGHVRRDENSLLLITEFVRDTSAIGLALARVEGRVAHAHRVEELRYELRLVRCRAENHYFAPAGRSLELFANHDRRNPRHRAHLRTEDLLRDERCGLRLGRAAHAVDHAVAGAQRPAEHARELGRHRRREAERLTLRRQAAHDVADLFAEPLVEQPIAFVENERLQGAQARCEPFVLHVVPQPSWRRHQEVNMPRKQTTILGHRCATKDADHADRAASHEALGCLGDLSGKLTSRRKHQRTNLVGRLRLRDHQSLDRRDQEGQSLARACTSLRHDIFARKQGRQRRCLY